MLEHYRAVLGFRRQHAVLRDGEMTDWAAEGGVFRFVRRGGEVIFCAFNLSGEAASITLPEGRWVGIGETVGSIAATGGTVHLPAWGICIARKA